MSLLALGGLALGAGLGNAIFGEDSSTQTLSTLTPEQQRALSQLIPELQNKKFNNVGSAGYNASAYGGGYSPTNYSGGFNPSAYSGGTPYSTNTYQNQLQGALTQSLSGAPSTNVNADVTEDFYRNSIERPAIEQYENVTRPEWMQRVSGIHSSARDRLESEGLQNLYGGLAQQRGNLMYQDEQARRDLAESAAGRQMQGIGAASGLSSQEQQAWYNQNVLNQNQWDTSNKYGLGAAQLGQEAWYNQNQLGLAANQQSQDAWQQYQNMLLGADQNKLQYQQAQLQQSALPYQLLLQSLGIQGQENVVTPGSNPFSLGLGLNMTA
jgi:hypothetical protein